jgi:glycosyltransferase involved in cell wall biosynthesis
VSRKLSIACLSHVASRQAPTGAERSLGLLAGALAARGHRVVVVAPGAWALQEELLSKGVEVETIPSRACWTTYWEPRPWPLAAGKWLRGLASSRANGRLASYLDRRNPDVVHVNCLPHLAGASAAARCGRPVLWHLREILPPGRRRRWWAQRLEEHASRVVAVSEAVGRWVRDEGLGERLEVVPNGVVPEGEPFDRTRSRLALGLDPAAGVVVGLFGQLVPHKGALQFIAAAARAAAREHRLRFVLAGAGPAAFRRRCEEAIATSGWADRFRLLPPQPSADELMAAADVVCLTTTTPDPFPRAVLEAMGAARPVAAFDSGGTAEMVVDGETGLIVPTGDLEALADAFCRLAADDVLRESMGSSGARRARDHFSLERHVDRMESLMLELAA